MNKVRIQRWPHASAAAADLVLTTPCCPSRFAAKLYHPDLRRGGTDADLNAFKAVNEAYSVLGDPSARRDYDHERFSRAATLKARNEGIYGTELPVDAPKSIYEAQGWETMRGSPATGTGTGTGRAASSNAAVGSAASFSSYSTEDNEEAFRRSMARATEKQRDSAKFRASFARMSRQKIEIPSRERTLMRLAAPLGVVVLWAFNWYFFMR